MGNPSQSKKNTADAAPSPPEGTCAVDIRIFLVIIVVAMSAAFFAGISVHLPLDRWLPLEYLTSNINGAVPVTSHLELSPTDIVTAGAHSPSGQHLLVDIRGIEADFLDSEERLSDAMVRTVQAGGLTMLSYHCHKLDPMGISCVGILMESHISFHTWPEEGVITLDLFTCGPNPLLPVVPVIETLFGIGENIETKWAHELRGFRSEEEKKQNYLDNFSDLSMWVLSPLEYYSKTKVYSNLTAYQRVDIWDIVEKEDIPSYQDGLKHNLADGDKRWNTPELFTPDRLLFLDGIIQSLYSSEAVYHEALVHPAMFSHPNPKHVAVLGGGEGATIREVLKHNTVEKVTMIEIDAEMIEIAREYLPQMSDCSDLEGRANNCFDDEAVTVINDDAVNYFHERRGLGESSKQTQLFDVFIVDALDPEDDVVFSKDLYADQEFVSSMLKSMADDGILLLQVGTAPDLSDPKPDIGSFVIREQLFSLFENHPDVAAMHVFEEPKSGFLEPHSFLMVCKDVSCRNNWYARSDVIDYEIYQRILPTKSKTPALKYFDGTTNYEYQLPPKAWETVYCRREPTPAECAYIGLDFSKPMFDVDLDNEENSAFRIEVNDSVASVFAKVGIPKGSYIMPEHLSRSVLVDEANIDNIQANAQMESPDVFPDLARVFEAHTHKSSTEGTNIRLLEVGATTAIREVEDEKSANVGRWFPKHLFKNKPVYSPVYDRQRMSFDVFMIATKDIPAGAELTRPKNLWID